MNAHKPTRNFLSLKLEFEQRRLCNYGVKEINLVAIINTMNSSTTISVGSQYQDFIQKEVAMGNYASPVEVVESALELLESEKRKLKKLQEALEAGEKSGFVSGVTQSKHLKSLHKKYL